MYIFKPDLAKHLHNIWVIKNLRQARNHHVTWWLNQFLIIPLVKNVGSVVAESTDEPKKLLLD